MISLVFLIQLAQAEESYSFGFPAQKMFNTGLTAGVSSTGFVGLECNYSVVKKSTWMGVYSDVFYDFTHQDTTITIGPRIGKMVFGVDGGLGVRMSGVGQIEFIECDRPGSDYRGVEADAVGLSLLQHKLNELNSGISVSVY